MLSQVVKKGFGFVKSSDLTKATSVKITHILGSHAEKREQTYELRRWQPNTNPVHK